MPANVKSERLSRLQDAQRRIQERKNLAHVGGEVEVLVDGASKKSADVLSGRDPHNRVVNFPGNQDRIGQMVHVRITAARPNSLFGEERS